MYQLTNLPYSYNSLEPALDEATMHLHHDKHHQTYVDKLNAVLEKYPTLTSLTVEALLKDLNSVPEEIRTGVKNFGGGFANHNFFWSILRPATEDNILAPRSLGEVGPVGELAEKLEEQFGNLAEFKKQLSDQAVGLFGSGWAWLVLGADKKLAIVTTLNQDSPLSAGQIPLLTIDVWEHAYYLKYQNRRAEYVEALWFVFNWPKIEEYYQLGLKA